MPRTTMHERQQFDMATDANFSVWGSEESVSSSVDCQYDEKDADGSSGRLLEITLGDGTPAEVDQTTGLLSPESTGALIQLAIQNRGLVLTTAQLNLFRTRLCQVKATTGDCLLGDSCPYSHCLSWPRRNPTEHFYRSMLCPDLEFKRATTDGKMRVTCRCRRRRRCAFSHTKEEQMYHPWVYKTQCCKSYMDKDASNHQSCHKLFCPFAHGKQELRTNPNDYLTDLLLMKNINLKGSSLQFIGMPPGLENIKNRDPSASTQDTLTQSLFDALISKEKNEGGSQSTVDSLRNRMAEKGKNNLLIPLQERQRNVNLWASPTNDGNARRFNLPLTTKYGYDRQIPPSGYLNETVHGARPRRFDRYRFERPSNADVENAPPTYNEWPTEIDCILVDSVTKNDKLRDDHWDVMQHLSDKLERLSTGYADENAEKNGDDQYGNLDDAKSKIYSESKGISIDERQSLAGQSFEKIIGAHNGRYIDNNIDMDEQLIVAMRRSHAAQGNKAGMRANEGVFIANGARKNDRSMHNATMDAIFQHNHDSIEWNLMKQTLEGLAVLRAWGHL